MKLSALIANDFFLPAEWDREFNHIVCDSRAVQQGDLFIARQGLHEHAQQYIDDAIAQGAVAVLVQGEQSFVSKESAYYVAVPVFYAEQVATHYATWLARRYPLNEIKLVAVTGTNGKSSVTQYIAQLTDQPCAVQGTLGNGVWPNLEDSGNTTADLSVILRQLHDYEQQGVKLAALEASSHGLEQGRLSGLQFAVALMTNFSQDHLDYHGSLDNYFSAKKRLFTEYLIATAIINVDDDYGLQLANDPSIAAHKITYGSSESADVRYQIVEFNDHGITAQLITPWGEGNLQLPLLGEFNLANAVAAIVALVVQGADFSQLCEKASTLQPVAGRMEVYQRHNSPLVVIDFAHTPDALANVLQALKPWQCSITTVFGCGGDRDRSKRTLMMQVAQEYSDQVWLTDDNVRFEDPQQIFADALAGGFTQHQEHDRKAAIELAVNNTRSTGIVLIAGKGHEDYQEIQGIKHAYSDKEVLLTMGFKQAGGRYA